MGPMETPEHPGGLCRQRLEAALLPGEHPPPGSEITPSAL